MCFKEFIKFDFPTFDLPTKQTSGNVVIGIFSIALNEPINILDYGSNILTISNLQNKINCKFIIIPTPNFIFEKAKKDWEDVFRFNYLKEFGPSDIAKSITSKYSNVYYPEGFFEYKDFIKYDNHLTGHGHSKLAEFTYSLFDK